MGTAETGARVTEPDRLLRVWSLMRATAEEMAHATPPPEAAPRLQQSLRAIREQLEAAVSPQLAAELQRTVPPSDAPMSMAELRIEYGLLVSWTGSLVTQMLAMLATHRGTALILTRSTRAGKAAVQPSSSSSRSRAAVAAGSP